MSGCCSELHQNPVLSWSPWEGGREALKRCELYGEERAIDFSHFLFLRCVFLWN